MKYCQPPAPRLSSPAREAAGAGWGDARGCTHRGAPAKKSSPHSLNPERKGSGKGSTAAWVYFHWVFSVLDIRGRPQPPRHQDLSRPLGAAALDREHGHLSPSPAHSTSQQPTGTAAHGTGSWRTASIPSCPLSPAGTGTERPKQGEDPAASLSPQRQRRLSVLTITLAPPAPPATLMGETFLGPPPAHPTPQGRAARRWPLLVPAPTARQQLRARSPDGVNLCHLLPWLPGWL